jgi:hypothetical protein
MFAVNAAIVDHEFGTREGSVHLAAAGIKPIRQRQAVPSQGCLPLQALPPGCVITTHTQPGPEPAAPAGRRGSWGGQQQWGGQRSSYGPSDDQQQQQLEGADYQQQWPGPEPVMQELPKQEFGFVLHQLSQASLLSQPRLLAAFSLYQLCFANVAHMQVCASVSLPESCFSVSISTSCVSPSAFGRVNSAKHNPETRISSVCPVCAACPQLVDTQMGELQRPVQLGAFLALQRLHLENMAELLQTEWAMKVRIRVCMSVHMQTLVSECSASCCMAWSSWSVV